MQSLLTKENLTATIDRLERRRAAMAAQGAKPGEIESLTKRILELRKRLERALSSGYPNLDGRADPRGNGCFDEGAPHMNDRADTQWGTAMPIDREEIDLRAKRVSAMLAEGKRIDGMPDRPPRPTYRELEAALAKKHQQLEVAKAALREARDLLREAAREIGELTEHKE